MSFRPVEVGSVDRPDHPSLRYPGCSEKARVALIYGMLGGAVFGAVWGLATCYKSRTRGAEALRKIWQSTYIHGGVFGGAGCAFFALDCY